MDAVQYQEILAYSQQNSRLQVSVNSSGNANVVMVPVVHLGEAQSPTDSLSQHVTTHIITPEQVRAKRFTASTLTFCFAASTGHYYGTTLCCLP